MFQYSLQAKTSCLQLHAEKTNGPIQWKESHQFLLCVKTANKRNYSSWFCANNIAFVVMLVFKPGRHFGSVGKVAMATL